MTRDDRALWIFGYGSLVWRPGFEFVEHRTGYVRGMSRRFWQASHDHRGTTDAPGLVVTLVDEAAAICWGRVYRVEPDLAATVIAQLDEREQGGYEQCRVDVTLVDGQRVEALTYIATPHNPNYVGPQELQTIAELIAVRVGPSGRNDEYLFRLAEALRDLAADDPHVFELERLVRAR